MTITSLIGFLSEAVLGTPILTEVLNTSGNWTVTKPLPSSYRLTTDVPFDPAKVIIPPFDKDGFVVMPFYSGTPADFFYLIYVESATQLRLNVFDATGAGVSLFSTGITGSGPLVRFFQITP